MRRLILGTPAYMAPEQVVGKAAYRRSDIFSFGAILYEMLPGERVFPTPANLGLSIDILQLDRFGGEIDDGLKLYVAWPGLPPLRTAMPF